VLERVFAPPPGKLQRIRSIAERVSRGGATPSAGS